MNLADLARIQVQTQLAADTSPTPGPVDGAASEAERDLTLGNPSSQQTGRQPGTGLDVLSKVSSLASTSSHPTAATLPLTSSFPYQGIDTIPLLENDQGQIVTAEDFNRLIADLRALEIHLLHIMRYAPLDLADRLMGSGRTLDGLDLTSGSSTLRRPQIATLGTRITVSGTSTGYVDSPNLALGSATRTALGLADTGTNIESAQGLGFIAGAKLQTCAVDPSTLDPASLCGRVEVLASDSEHLQLTLCPGVYSPAGVPDPTSFAQNGNIPYLAPGVWYLWITFFLSPYLWTTL